jgi:hypothetical protein
MTKPVKPKAERAKCLENVAPLSLQDDVCREKWPMLHDLLSSRWKEGKQVRVGSRIGIRAEGAAYRVSIDCTTEGLSASFLVVTLVDLFDEIEQKLANGRVTWGLSYAAAKRGRQGVEELLP